jgi:LmbE family N-acetylglucosaminyl deacetylase
MPDDALERVLVFSAHPDDVDFGVAGSVAVWTDVGVEVSYCIVTDGAAGGSDRSLSRAEMADLRKAEQTAAAKAVGVEDVVFLDYPDGRLEPTLDLRRDLSRVIRQRRPQRVVAQSPERVYARIYASHPDHLAAGEAALSAVYPDSRNPFAHPELLEDEGLEPWTVPEVWLMAIEAPDEFVDITETFDRKLEALLCHVSQLPEPSRMEPLLRDWARANAERAGLQEGRLAEAFLRVATG